MNDLDPNSRFLHLLATTQLPTGDAIQRTVNRLLPRLGIVNALGRVRWNTAARQPKRVNSARRLKRAA